MKNVLFFLTALLMVVFSATFAQKSLTNVALNASVSASSEERPASAAVDGDHTSYWQSGSFVGTHWLKIDLGHEHEIDRILLPLIRGVNHLVMEVELENGIWKEVYSGDTKNPLIGFEPERTRRIRLMSADGGQMRVYEVRVAVAEVGTSSNRFRGTFTVPDDQTDPIKVAYGIAWHETYVVVAIE